MFLNSPGPIVQTVPFRPNRVLRLILRICFAVWLLGTLVYVSIFALHLAERTRHGKSNRTHRNAPQRQAGSSR